MRVLHATLHIFLLSRTLRHFFSSPGCGQDSTQTSPERRGSTWHPERESRHRPSVLHYSSKRLGWKGWARRLAYHFIFMGGLVDPQLRASNFIDRLIGSGQVVLHCAHHHPLQPGEQRVPQHILIVRVLRARRAVWLLPISFPFCEHRGLTRPPAPPCGCWRRGSVESSHPHITALEHIGPLDHNEPHIATELEGCSQRWCRGGACL